MENNRSKMDRGTRAKQFMPFDALKGFREAITEKERIIVPKRDLSEEQKDELERKIKQLKKKELITVEYFNNREYVQVTGMVTRIDAVSRTLDVVNTRIAFRDISSLRCERILE
ncbi:YolD-like family protein [Anaerocolumna sp. AGMB13020]|uniref:YolD-like family protein n=1 Tax=Anaerocolumna sp. AGMB13020 TaxID=3081750 RepID=UPI002955AF16|nr:YolD-like family protein [Anaerocolumna sp. AGMB13020]WOO37956.1 YolD-like family protein [Anaerocolumna sp. AGMB13020]